MSVPSRSPPSLPTASRTTEDVFSIEAFMLTSVPLSIVCGVNVAVVFLGISHWNRSSDGSGYPMEAENMFPKAMIRINSSLL